MSVLCQCTFFSCLVLCTLSVGVCQGAAPRAAESDDDSISYAETLSAMQKIVDQIPAELRPTDSRDATGTSQRKKANQWLAENLVGKPVEFSIKIGKASVTPQKGDSSGALQVVITVADQQLLFDGNLSIDAGIIHSGGTNWRLFYLLPRPAHPGAIDEAESERLQALKGKTLKVTATVSAAKENKNKRTPTKSPAFSIDKVHAAAANRVIADRTLQVYLSDVIYEGLDTQK